jgi:uncharacterized repeat protein (TIGR02543 family)
MTIGMTASLGGKAQAAPGTYTLRFSNNGISGVGNLPKDVATDPRYPTVKIPTQKPTRANYVFQGYDTSSSAKTVVYKPGASIKLTKALTILYPVWSGGPTTYQIKFSTNGVSGITNMPSNISVGAGSRFSIPTTIPKRSGYSFDGWNTSPSAQSGNSNYAPGKGNILASGNLTLYPIWKLQVTYHIMEAQNADYSAVVNSTIIKEIKNGTVSERNGTTLANASNVRNLLSAGYYLSDSRGNKLSDSTKITAGLNVYIWPYKDEITIKWCGTSTTMYVYTGLSLATSFDNLYGFGRGRKYPVGNNFVLNGVKNYVLGWKLNGGNRKNQIVSPGLRLTCNGSKYDADVVTKTDGVSLGYNIHMSATELRVMYELTDKKYQSAKPSESDTLSSVLSNLALTYIGIKDNKVLSTASSLFSCISSIGTSINGGEKMQLAHLHGQLDAFVGNYMNTNSWATREYYVTLKCHVEKCELILDDIKQY